MMDGLRRVIGGRDGSGEDIFGGGVVLWWSP